MLVRAKSGFVVSLAGFLGSLALAGATPAHAAAEATLSLSLYVRDVDEEGTFSNGDEVFINVVRDGYAQRFAPVEGTIDVDESDEGQQVGLGSTNPLTFPVGSTVTIQVWEDDVSGDDLLVEVKDVPVQCNRAFAAVTAINKQKYYNYSVEGNVVCP
ncbi:hypothetical protein ACWEQG_21625 [Microbispora sp. NPDC004025]